MNALPVLNWLLRTSWQASVLVLLVLAAQWLFRRRLNARWQYALWLLVVARLAMPSLPASSWSVFNVVHYAAGKTAAPRKASDVVRPIISIPATEQVMNSGSFPENIDRGHTELPPTIAPPKFDKQHLMRNAAIVWLAGLLLLGGRAVGQNIAFVRRLRDAKAVTDAETLAVFVRCKEVMGVSAALPLAETDHVKSPALYGFFRPTLLLPRRVMGQFSPAEQQNIFLHELAHVKRRDMAVHWLATVFRLLHWFNPMLWYGFQRMAADRELACDELALSRAGGDEARPYGETVLKLLELCARPEVLPGLMGILEEKSQMTRRILRIARYKQQTGWPILALLLMIGLGLLTLTDAHSEKPGLDQIDKVEFFKQFVSEASGNLALRVSRQNIFSFDHKLIQSTNGPVYYIVQSTNQPVDYIEFAHTPHGVEAARSYLPFRMGYQSSAFFGANVWLYNTNVAWTVSQAGDLTYNLHGTNDSGPYLYDFPELLSLGIPAMKGSLTWSGNSFKATTIGAAASTNTLMTGSLKISNGLPAEVSYSWDYRALSGNIISGVVHYSYGGEAKALLPSEIRVEKFSTSPRGTKGLYAVNLWRLTEARLATTAEDDAKLDPQYYLRTRNSFMQTVTPGDVAFASNALKKWGLSDEDPFGQWKPAAPTNAETYAALLSAVKQPRVNAENPPIMSNWFKTYLATNELTIARLNERGQWDYGGSKGPPTVEAFAGDETNRVFVLNSSQGGNLVVFKLENSPKSGTIRGYYSLPQIQIELPIELHHNVAIARFAEPLKFSNETRFWLWYSDNDSDTNRFQRIEVRDDRVYLDGGLLPTL